MCIRCKLACGKKEIGEQAQQLFAGKRGLKPVAEHADPEVLYSQIGKLHFELDWLKKSQVISVLTSGAPGSLWRSIWPALARRH